MAYYVAEFDGKALTYSKRDAIVTEIYDTAIGLGLQPLLDAVTDAKITFRVASDTAATAIAFLPHVTRVRKADRIERHLTKLAEKRAARLAAKGADAREVFFKIRYTGVCAGPPRPVSGSASWL